MTSNKNSLNQMHFLSLNVGTLSQDAYARFGIQAVSCPAILRFSQRSVKQNGKDPTNILYLSVSNVSNRFLADCLSSSVSTSIFSPTHTSSVSDSEASSARFALRCAKKHKSASCTFSTLPVMAFH